MHTFQGANRDTFCIGDHNPHLIACYFGKGIRLHNGDHFHATHATYRINTIDYFHRRIRVLSHKVIPFCGIKQEKEILFCKNHAGQRESVPYNHLPHTPFKHIGIKPISEPINGVRTEGTVLQPRNDAPRQRGLLLPLQQGNPSWPKQTGVARPFIVGEGDAAQLVPEGVVAIPEVQPPRRGKVGSLFRFLGSGSSFVQGSRQSADLRICRSWSAP